MNNDPQKNKSLIAALRKAEAARFAAVPAEETLDHTFSAGFQKKMGRLIRVQRTSFWQLVNTPQKRAAFLFMILLLTFGVRPDRNPLFRYVQPVPQLSIVVAPDVNTQTRPIAEARPHTAGTGAQAREEPAGQEELTYKALPETTAVPTVSADKPAPSAAPSAAPAQTEAPAASPAAPEYTAPTTVPPVKEEAPGGADEAAARPEYRPEYVPLPDPDPPTESAPDTAQNESDIFQPLNWQDHLPTYSNQNNNNSSNSQARPPYEVQLPGESSQSESSYYASFPIFP